MQIGQFNFATSASDVSRSVERSAELRRSAQALEAGFLSEMLKHAGLEEMNGAFGGGVGEEQFASFLRDEQAKRMVTAGGIGLAETIFNALEAREANDVE
ncbi:rod-binding protein [Thioclava pacifica]|uniref:rod-binding protein n=1 Tax=Thioclava pacifica TaxID=285109 RepID=UPI00056EB8A0|nr:rod-binding protein [Thioclava pacifica]